MDPLPAAGSKKNIVVLLLLGLVIGLVVAGLWQWLKTPAVQQLSFVSTIAGTKGELGEAFGIAAWEGTVYVSDGQNGKIWKITDGRMVPFVEGLDTPSGMAFRKTGELIVADAGSNTIKSISQQGDITTIAGVSGKRGFADGDAAAAFFNGPIGVAVADDGRIFVADTYNDRIRLIKDDKVSTIAGNTEGFADGNGVQAQFDTPCGLAIWKDKVLVADTGNTRIRIIEPDGRVSTILGTGDSFGATQAPNPILPVDIAVDAKDVMYFVGGNAIRGFDLTTHQSQMNIGVDRGLRDGDAYDAAFNRPSGLAFDRDGSLLVADSENRVVRRLSSRRGQEITREQVLAIRDKPEDFRNAAPARWPYDPPDAKREIAGTLGEVRGEVKADNDQVWFHNGLDIAGGYGETARFVREEKVLRPIAVDNFNNLRESIRMPTMGYVHIRLGRNQEGVPLGDERFQFQKDAKGKIVGVRVPRGVHFNAGDPIGTLNSMNHVHLIAGRSGSEMNALDALILPGYSDGRPPVIETVALFAADSADALKPPYLLLNKTRVEMAAYDQVDGNADRRRLGIYRAGYQLLRSDLSPVSDIKWTISFARLPDGAAVRSAYGVGSKSGATGETIFDYIVTDEVDGDHFGTSYLDASVLENGSYVLRVFAADQAGNETHLDKKFEVKR